MTEKIKRILYSEASIGDVHSSTNFGDYKIISLGTCSKKVTVEFIDTGYQCVVPFSCIVWGRIKDKLKPHVKGHGFIGDGEHRFINKDGTNNKTYNIWTGILERVYCPLFDIKRPTYRGCTVCEEWHNFQNFAKWYEDNYPKDGLDYHLDKDIKIDGNKLYSPETCLFVSQRDNTEKAKAKYYTVQSPEGGVTEIYNLKKWCAIYGLTHANMLKVANGERTHHKGWKCQYLNKEKS